MAQVFNVLQKHPMTADEFSNIVRFHILFHEVVMVEEDSVNCECTSIGVPKTGGSRDIGLGELIDLSRCLPTVVDHLQ